VGFAPAKPVHLRGIWNPKTGQTMRDRTGNVASGRGDNGERF